MRETFPPRPTLEDFAPVLHSSRADQLLKAEREWFERLLAHPHVQAVMHIPPGVKQPD